jgi:nitroimidazol reductase NimA-like FMN-containing flavoprotein (pyridoxamine 5'-phosphate oxidase superfamily)
MVVPTATAMDAIEIADFLESQATGVIALGKSGSVYAFPVSYAYNDEEPAVYSRFGFGENSQKRASVENADEVSFVVYDHTDVGWKSVLAEGQLEHVSPSKRDTSVVEAVNALRIPYFEVHRRPAAELEFSVHRLQVDKLSGIVEAQASD